MVELKKRKLKKAKNKNRTTQYFATSYQLNFSGCCINTDNETGLAPTQA
jgi:hypothetical protein